ncbi:uncharacterized protein [Solanum lycopersicum]|uniref:uncharacterized protein n=1 Tax=Solanum lycopersicum TaxID=4081 RepID=UPI0037478E70
MNTRSANGHRRGGEIVGGNQNPPQAPAEGVPMPVNPIELTNAEVRASLAQMALDITMQAQAMTAQVNRQDVPRENPQVSSMADRLRDFTRKNPHIFTSSKTSEDPQKFVDEVHTILVAMGATDIVKAELASYHLKDVAQTWCKMCQDSRVLVREYSLKFVKLSSKDDISRFLTKINGDLEEECWSVMIHDNVDLSRLMVHVHQVEYNRKKRGVRDVKSGGSPEPHKGNGGEMQHSKKNCAKCGRVHSGKCRQGTNACFGCGKSGHKVRECPQNRGRAGGNAQARPNPQGAAAAEPPKRNRFYTLKGREEQEKSADVVIDSVPVVNEFLDVFPEDLPGVPPF